MNSFSHTNRIYKYISDWVSLLLLQYYKLPKPSESAKLIASDHFTALSLVLTTTPGIAEQDEFANCTGRPAVLSEHTQLKSVVAHRGRGRRADEYGGSLEVQAFWVNIGIPTGGRNLLGGSDWNYHIQAA